MLALKNITKIYSKLYALKNINLDLTKQETTVIIGTQNAGKTTLLRILSNLEEPTKGSLTFNDEKLSTKNNKNFRLKVGVVLNNNGLFSRFNVLDNLTYAPINVLNLPKDDAEAKACQLLEEFKLTQKAKVFPSHLSNVQKIKVSLARSLMMGPKILILDDLSFGLDYANARNIIKIIDLLKKDYCLIIATSDLNLAKIVADRIIFLDQGQVLADQPAADFFIKPNSRRARLFLEE